MADTPSDEQLLATVAEGEAEMEALLSDLVRARPVFGAEADGQDVMRRAYAGLALGDGREELLVARRVRHARATARRRAPGCGGRTPTA